MGRYYDYYVFPRAAPRPKAVAGKERKKFGETWWGKKWVENLSKYEHDQRMSRGKAYARADKVKKFSVGEGAISAIVEGSSGNYNVHISFKEHSEKDWHNIVKKIWETPLLLGKLLNNEMPTELEEATGFTFIPSSFNSKCSCPDYANPCKHIAAVFYTIADDIDHDPMNLLLIHGMGKDELFLRLELNDAPPAKMKSAPYKERKTKRTTKKSKKTKKMKKHG